MLPGTEVFRVDVASMAGIKFSAEPFRDVLFTAFRTALKLTYPLPTKLFSSR
jgi:hypothetical protein